MTIGRNKDDSTVIEKHVEQSFLPEVCKKIMVIG
jgi:hypothetical protein